MIECCLNGRCKTSSEILDSEESYQVIASFALRPMMADLESKDFVSMINPILDSVSFDPQ